MTDAMSGYEYTPTEFAARQVYAAGDVHLEAEFDRMIAVVERAAKAGALRDAKARCLAAAGWTGNATITLEQVAESLETLAVELEKGEGEHE